MKDLIPASDRMRIPPQSTPRIEEVASSPPPSSEVIPRLRADEDEEDGAETLVRDPSVSVAPRARHRAPLTSAEAILEEPTQPSAPTTPVPAVPETAAILAMHRRVIAILAAVCIALATALVLVLVRR
jgi:hypothetical protein